MEIKIIKHNKKDFLDLLLLADEQEDMIDRYLDRGTVFALYDGGLKSICVVTDEGDGAFEIQNLATYEQFQGRGYGRRLIHEACKHYAGKGETMYVGTGDSKLTIPFYEKSGFVFSHRVENYILEHYDNPIYEDGVQLKDKVYLKRSLCGSPRGKPDYSHVIWDWNGTLFDDVGWCMKVINTMLENRELPTLATVADYRRVFCFPIIQYYRNVGFDFDRESFETLAQEYIARYHAGKTGNCKLFPEAEAVLAAVRQKGIHQVILSASECGNLTSQMGEFPIACYFDEILGISDIYATSKVDIGLDYMARKQAARAVLIGDTQHDHEVASALGVDCILIPGGHQSREVLQTCNVPVLDDISCVAEYLGL